MESMSVPSRSNRNVERDTPEGNYRLARYQSHRRTACTHRGTQMRSWRAGRAGVEFREPGGTAIPFPAFGANSVQNFETVLALLVGVTFLALVSRRLAIPTPALLVTGGLLVALLPGPPAVWVQPQLGFFIFLP